MNPLARLTATAALSFAATLATAQDCPEAGVRMIVPLTPGSGADTAGRAIAQAPGKLWKQPAMIDNRPGAGGLIGTSAVANAEPNGLTLLVQSVSYAANTAILVDFSLIGDTPCVMVTAPDIATIAERGFAGFDISLWFGVWAPAGTPAAVVQKINADIALALQDSEVVAAFGRTGIQPRSLGTAEFTRFVRDEMAGYQAIAISARIEPQ